MPSHRVSPAGRASGIRSGTGCRCRTARAARRATRRGTDSPNWGRAVRLPSSRADCARAPGPAPSASDRRRVLVAVEVVADRNVAQQPLAPLIGAATVHYQPKRPATSRDGATEVPPYVRVLGRAEEEPLHTIRPYAFARRAIGLLADRGRRPARDRQYGERDGQQRAHTRGRSRHTGRRKQPVAHAIPYCAHTARGAQRSPKAPANDRIDEPGCRAENPATPLNSVSSRPLGSDAVLPYHGSVPQALPAIVAAGSPGSRTRVPARLRTRSSGASNRLPRKARGGGVLRR